jgi:hypothetical protein
MREEIFADYLLILNHFFCNVDLDTTSITVIDKKEFLVKRMSQHFLHSLTPEVRKVVLVGKKTIKSIFKSEEQNLDKL